MGVGRGWGCVASTGAAAAAFGGDHDWVAGVDMRLFGGDKGEVGWPELVAGVLTKRERERNGCLFVTDREVERERESFRYVIF